MKQVVMCPPKYFEIAYEINPWMHKDTPVNRGLMQQEWEAVRAAYQKLGWKVNIIEPAAGQPDMVFATDNCLMFNDKIMLSNFRYAERRGEIEHFGQWLRAHGFRNIRQANPHFEGGGDNLVCGNKILAGHGFRSDPQAADELRDYFGCEVISLHLINPYFYHLDTAVAVLSLDTIAFYPQALDEPSQARLRATVPNTIEATLEEAQGFALNAVSDGKTVITSDESPSLLAKYQATGLKTIALPMGEFKKAGGGIKCMTLDLRP
jgi:N-dimethylarginine dimethylaminohydrolase